MRVMIDALWLPGFDPASGTMTMPWWMAAAVAAFVVVAVVLAMLRGGPAVLVGGLAAVAFLLLVGTITWVGNERVAERERAEARQALAARAQELAREAAMPGSTLGCLDANAGETLEAACERVLFGSPEAVAGAIAFTAARIALLSDGVDHAIRTNASYEPLLPGLRPALESDRYGFVAQVLSAQYGCSADRCEVLALFREANRISANLKDRPFDVHVAKNAASWSQRNNNAGSAPVASASGPSRVPPGFNVPSAAAIPPISIMVPESTSTATGTAPPGEAAAQPAPPPRRPPPAKTARPAQPKQAPPQQVAPQQVAPADGNTSTGSVTGGSAGRTP